VLFASLQANSLSFASLSRENANACEGGIFAREGVYRMRSKDFVRGKNRTHCITTRMNDEELEELKRRKGNIPYGVYIRQVLLGKPPKQVPEVNRQAYAETARWASALNQIARKLNMGEDVDITEIRRVLNAFRQKLLGITFEGDENDHQGQSG